MVCALTIRYRSDVPGVDAVRGVIAEYQQGPAGNTTCRANPLLYLVRVGSISDNDQDRVLRLAWTISDLSGANRPDRDDISTIRVRPGPFTAAIEEPGVGGLDPHRAVAVQRPEGRHDHDAERAP